MTQKINKAGIDLIKSFEGLRLHSYKDSKGVWTIGWGHTKDVKSGQVITNKQAEEFFLSDITTFESAVNELNLPLNDNQFAALVSFAFNLGQNNLKKLIRLGVTKIPDRILLFNHVDGKVSEGITRRRKAERKLYLLP